MSVLSNQNMNSNNAILHVPSIDGNRYTTSNSVVHQTASLKLSSQNNLNQSTINQSSLNQSTLNSSSLVKTQGPHFSQVQSFIRKQSNNLNSQPKNSNTNSHHLNSPAPKLLKYQGSGNNNTVQQLYQHPNPLSGQAYQTQPPIPPSNKFVPAEFKAF